MTHLLPNAILTVSIQSIEVDSVNVMELEISVIVPFIKCNFYSPDNVGFMFTEE